MQNGDTAVRVKTPRDRINAFGSDRHAQQEASLGDLLSRLTSDTTALVQQEVALAKAELKQTGIRLGKDAAKIGVAVALAFVGGLALTAFLIIALGKVLGGSYWLSALLVGVVAFGVGYAMVKSAIKDIGDRGITPQQTVDSLRENQQWAKREGRDLKRDLTNQSRSYSTSSSTL